MRVTLVGAGVVGLLTAVECVLAGHAVTLVEQGTIPCPDATSSDRHRIIRALHRHDPAATADGVAAHARWTELETLLSQRFYRRVGALTVLPATDLPDAVSCMTGAGASAQVLDADELARTYPRLSFPAGTVGVLESDAGVLLADRVLLAAADWLRRNGATLLPHHRVVDVDTDTASVHLADGGRIDADAVLVAAGPWSRALLPPDVAAGLSLYRQSLLYCEVPAARREWWAGLPAIPALGEGAWLVPPVAGTPLKLSAASACRAVDRVTDSATPPAWRDHLLTVFGTLIDGFDPDWVTGTADCYYLADTDTGGRVLVSPGAAVHSLAACGGGSFKFAPLIARSLARRVPARPAAVPAVLPVIAVQGGFR